MSVIYGKPVNVGGGSKIPQNLPPLNPNFSVKRTGGSITAKADKLLVGSDTSMLAGGVWVYKANGIPQNPKDGTVKKWSVADLVDMGAAKAGGKMVQLKDIPVATTSSPTYTMLSDNGKQQKYVIVQNNSGASTPNVILYREGMLPDTIQFNQVESESYFPYENSELDAYCSGYISKLDKNIQSFLVEAPVVLYDSHSKQTKTINRKTFTPSIANIFGNNAINGNTQFEWAKTFKNLNLPLGNTFWTSTTSAGMGTRKIEAIGAAGAYFSRGQTETAAIILLIAMNPDTWFVDNGNGSYTFVGESPAATVEWTFQFPETTPCYVRQYTFNQKGQYQTMLQGAVASTEDKPQFMLPVFTGNHAIFGDETAGRIELYESGTLTLSPGTYDFFLVGGGGRGDHGGGAGSGYTHTEKAKKVDKTQVFSVLVGASDSKSEISNKTAGNILATAEKGSPGTLSSGTGNGGNGGSGGGSYGTGGNGGSNGSNGGKGSAKGNPGQGQGTTTRSFGEENGVLFAGGGGAAAVGNSNPPVGGEGGGGRGGTYDGKTPNTPGTPNTGGGGGSRSGTSYIAPGGSGIIIVRWNRAA